MQAENNDGQEKKRPLPANNLMPHMTFTSLGRMRCDCDECGNQFELPFAIQQAVDAYQSKRLKRTQERQRIGPPRTVSNISIWHWTMPLGAEPLTEFGSTSRIIWIQKLPQQSVLQAIGKGILGSSEEVEGRTTLDNWAQGHVYYVPSNGGKSVGWVHSLREKVGENNELVSPAVLIIIKCPSNLSTDQDVPVVETIFQKLDKMPVDDPVPHKRMEAEDASAIIEYLQPFVDASEQQLMQRMFN